MVPVSPIYSTYSFLTFILQSTSPQTTGISHILSAHRTSRVEIYCSLFHGYNTECPQDHSRLGNAVVAHQVSVVVEMWALRSAVSAFTF